MAEKENAWVTEPLPGFSDVQLAVNVHVEAERAQARQFNQLAGDIAVLCVLQDQAWQRYTSNTLRPRQLVWDRATDTLGQVALAKLDIAGWERDELVNNGRKSVGKRHVGVHWRYMRLEQIEATTAQVETTVLVNPTEKAANDVTFQAAAVLLSTKDNNDRKWALKNLGEFGSKRKVLDRSQPDTSHLRLAVGAYVLSNADSISITCSTNIIGSDAKKEIESVMVRHIEVDPAIRPYYLQPKHADELPEVIRATKKALSGAKVFHHHYFATNALVKASMADYVEFLDRECGQLKFELSSMSRFGGSHGGSPMMLKLAWDEGPKCMIEINEEYKLLSSLLDYMDKSTPSVM